MLLLTLSIAALVAGPLLHLVAKRVGALSALDGFVVMSILGLVVVHIVPHATVSAGFAAIVVTLLGMLGPGLVERALHRAASTVHSLTFFVAIFGLVIHGFFDGVGLAIPSGLHANEVSMLPLAVLLHRLPVSATLWWLLHPRVGTLKTALILAGVGVATYLGYETEAFAASLDTAYLGLIQAFVAGSVLHVILHQPASSRDPKSSNLHAGLGALAGLLMVVLMSLSSESAHVANETTDIGATFLELCLESAPALLFAFLISGFVHMLLPTLPKKWMHSKSPSREAMRGVIFGLPLPICSCGVVPLYRTLVQQSVPATAAMAFLVATPELGLDAIILSWPLLGPQMTVLRIIAALILALAAGVIVGKAAKSAASVEPEPAEFVSDTPSTSSWPQKIRFGLSFGLSEVVDHTGPWLLLGLAIAAMISPIFQGSWIAQLPFGIDVLFFTLLGLPAYVCASGATPLVAVLLAQGVSPGAGLAFLLAGPATNITTYGILASLHGNRIATFFAALMGSMALALGLIVNILADRFVTIDTPSFHQHEASLFAWLCLGALGLVFAASLIRQGPRGFVEQILSPFSGDDAASDAHCCDH